MRLPRTLDPVEIRVLGALLEKEQATPEYYPLTVNALVAACNQRSNREPVMELEPADVMAALDRLTEDVMVWRTEGARSEKWRHNLDRRWELDPATKAVMTLLLLRGAQTPGELRGRSERLHLFASPADAEATLQGLTEGPEPLVVQLERRPGQKESRWMHLVGGEPGDVAPEPVASAAPATGLAARVTELEERVEQLEADLQRLLEALD
jgi:uncharacterized protein YceH (UPF0502 family)